MMNDLRLKIDDESFLIISLESFNFYDRNDDVTYEEQSRNVRSTYVIVGKICHVRSFWCHFNFILLVSSLMFIMHFSYNQLSTRCWLCISISNSNRNGNFCSDLGISSNQGHVAFQTIPSRLFCHVLQYVWCHVPPANL